MQAQPDQTKEVLDVKIMQKVNEAHRYGFLTKFPGIVEHCMRLTSERLQQGLLKTSEYQISDRDACDLSQALVNLYSLHCQLRDQ